MRAFLSSALILLATLPAAAELPDSALGAAGELYTAKAGTYRELFPDGDALSAGRSALAVETVSADGRVSRSLVPGTGNARVESQPALLYDRRSDSILVIWQSTAADGDWRRIHFVTRGSDGWSAVRTLMDADAVAVRIDGMPLAAVTHDAFELTLDDGSVLGTTRRVVHLLYSAEGSVWYTPLIFVEGAHVGWIESLDLGRSFFHTPADDGAAVAALPASLGRAISLQVSNAKRSVVAAFANSASGRLGAVEISMLPLDVELLGDFVRDRIFAEVELYDPGDISSFSGAIGAQLIAIGMHTELHPGTVEFVSDQVRTWLENSAADYGWAGFEDLGNDARDLAIYLTGSVSAALVADPATGDDILEIDLGDFLAALGNESALSQLVDVEVRSNRLAPAIDAGSAAIFPSRNGRDLLIGWSPDGSGSIRYVESRANADGGAWSSVRRLALGDGLTAEQAIALLEQKIR